MTLIQTAPKKIYIWVDESGYTYDFRNKSTATVQADGWQTTGTSTVYWGANGFDNDHIEEIKSEKKSGPDVNDYIKYIAETDDPIKTLSDLIK